MQSRMLCMLNIYMAWGACLPAWSWLVTYQQSLPSRKCKAGLCKADWASSTSQSISCRQGIIRKQDKSQMLCTRLPVQDALAHSCLLHSSLDNRQAVNDCEHLLRGWKLWEDDWYGCHCNEMLDGERHLSQPAPFARQLFRTSSQCSDATESLPCVLTLPAYHP